MPPASSAHLRREIEESLARRIPSALTIAPRIERDVLPMGDPLVDALLAGGLPVGAITEIVGAPCSGRTAFAHAYIAQVVRGGSVCAWIDSSDCFDAQSAAASGTDLDRVLWVRCGRAETDTQVSPTQVAPAPADRAPQFAKKPEPGSTCGGPHPRSEVRGLPEAVDAFLTRQISVPRKEQIGMQIGTPGMSNRSVASANRTEQVPTDRLPSRRGEALLQQRATFEPRCAEAQRRVEPEGKDRTAAQPSISSYGPRSYAPAGVSGMRISEQRRCSPWHRLDQALRATDLLMQAGGFGALVLDLGSMSPEVVNRIPLATWFRFRAAADRTRTSFVLLTQHPCAQSSAEVVLRTVAAMPEAGTVMTALPFTVEVVRQRFRPARGNVVPMRKPPQSAKVAAWSAPAAWVGGR